MARWPWVVVRGAGLTRHSRVSPGSFFQKQHLWGQDGSDSTLGEGASWASLRTTISACDVECRWAQSRRAQGPAPRVPAAPAQGPSRLPLHATRCPGWWGLGRPCWG